MIPTPRRSDVRHSRFILRSAALVVALGTGTTALGVTAANGATRQVPKNLCGAVSGAQVSSIVGFHVPNGVGTTNTEAPTKANDGIGGKSLFCTYGSFTAGSLKHLVAMGVETLTRSVSGAEFEALFKKEVASQGKGFTVAPYPGLGSNAIFYKFSTGGYTVEGIFLVNGTHAAFAFVYTAAVSKTNLANLTKLAQNLG